MKFSNKRKGRVPKGPRNLFFLVLVFLGTLALLTKLMDYTRHVKTITYSTFLNEVEQDRIRKVTVSGQDVQGAFKSGTRFETVVPYTTNHWDTLKDHNVNIRVENVSNQFSLWHILLFGLIIAALAVIFFMFRQSRSSSGGGSNIFTLGKSRAKMFMPSTIKENFNSVAGAVEAKEELHDVVDFLRNPAKYRRLGAKITRGVLLIGEPGNGKTLLAKAVAGEANCPFFSASGSDFIEVFVGVGAARVRDLFAQARKCAPSIIFIDELDAVGRQRGSGLGGGNDEREQTLNQLLAEMDGFQTEGGAVIVLAATNRSDVLDKALLRPGRFDRRVVVPYPDLHSREQILCVHAKGVSLDPKIDLATIARGTPGFSGADLANLINEAAIIASKKDQKAVYLKDLEEARDKIILGKEVKSMVQTKEDLEVTSYHESGHALLTLLQPEDSDPLHKVSIIPRGRALGITHSFPEREKYTTTKQEMLAKIASLLGGRVAEELVFQKATTGACSDFMHATEISHNMVCTYGMSDLGPIVYNQQNSDFAYSQKMAENIDQEIQKIVSTCYDKAMTLLRQNRYKLDLLAQELLRKETLYASEIYELLSIIPREDYRFVQ